MEEKGKRYFKSAFIKYYRFKQRFELMNQYGKHWRHCNNGCYLPYAMDCLLGKSLYSLYPRIDNYTGKTILTVKFITDHKYRWRVSWSMITCNKTLFKPRRKCRNRLERRLV